MKIGIDARFWGPSGKGLGRYSQKLIEELEKIDFENQYVIFLSPHNFEQYTPQNPNFRKICVDITWYSWKEQWQFPRILKRYKIDLMHFLHFNVPVLYRGPFITTIHDLILLDYPTHKASKLSLPYYWLKYLAYLLTIRVTTWKARHIIAISDFTKDSIEKHFRGTANKTTRIYNGIDLEKFNPVNKGEFSYSLFPMIIPGKFFLYVGNVYPHKNIEGLLRSFRRMVNDSEVDSDIRLVIVGKTDYFFERVIALSRKLKLQDRVVFPGFVPDDQLLQLYEDCMCYVFPSLHEGFGLPPLEAMAMGAPVLIANSTCLPEVFGPDVAYMDPHDEEDMYQAMKGVTRNPDFKQQQNQVAEQLLNKYSWSDMAKKTRELYNKTMKIK